MAAPNRWPVNAIVVLGLLASGCAPSPTSSVTSSPSAAPSESEPRVVGFVTSERFGWSMELPEPEWRYRAASEDWPPHTYPTAGAAYTDNFERPGGGFPVIDVSTQGLPADQTPDQFMADLDAGNADIGCEAASTEDVTVDGVVGRYQVQMCFGGFETVVEVIVFDGNRVYAIYWVGLAEDAASDEPVFRQILSTFRFPTTDY